MMASTVASIGEPASSLTQVARGRSPIERMGVCGGDGHDAADSTQKAAPSLAPTRSPVSAVS
jgi:hypothetical protein